MKNNEFITACRLQLCADLQHIFELNTQDPGLKHKVCSLIFSQGLSHADKGTGLFQDRYLRSGIMKPEDYNKSLLYAAAALTKDQLLIPMHDITAAQQTLRALQQTKLLFNFEIITKNLAGKEVTYLKADYQGEPQEHTTQLLDLVRFIGIQGAWANKDTLLWVLSDAYQNNWQGNNFPINTLPINTRTISELETDIQKLLNTPIHNKNRDLLQQNSYEFYMNFLSALLAAFFVEYKKNSMANSPQQDLLKSAMRRMIFKLNYAIANAVRFSDFILGLELAFDELALILIIMQFYTTGNLLALIPNTFVDESNFNGTECILAAVTGSCMSAVNLNIKAALKYFATPNNPDVRLYVPSLYYEIPLAWQITPDFDNDRYIVLQDEKPITTEKYQQQMVDIMILSTNDNVSPNIAGFGSNDLHAKINQQLALRKNSNSGKQMIVILDATMNQINDIQLELLFSAYQTNIQNGELAFIMVSSLNKFRNGCGFDRAPGGASVTFYTPDKFAGFECVQGLIGFQESDMTPQVLAHTMKYAVPFMQEHNCIIKGLTRHIHDHIIPQELFNPQNPIYIDNPYTKDIYTNTWTFLVIRGSTHHLHKKITPLVIKFLEQVDIKFRGGFAYDQTFYSLHTFEKIIMPRINIGPDANALQFSLIVKYLEHMNAAIQQLKLYPDTDNYLEKTSQRLADTAEEVYHSAPKKTHRLMLQ